MSGICWTDEAIEAALHAWGFFPQDANSPQSDMRAALDAAVKAQGIFDDLNDAHGVGYMQGRAEALEEVENALCGGTSTPMKMTIRDVIHELKETKG